MDRWENNVAVVSGASSGIGAAITKDLIRAGLTVVGVARRDDRIASLRSDLPKVLQSKLINLKCDVTKEDEVKAAFEWIIKTLGQVDILVNCAGVMKIMPMTNLDSGAVVSETVNTNIMGIYYCTREAYHAMKTRNSIGHIINLNSIAGHQVPIVGPTSPSVNIYPATKFAVRAMTETFRHEFRNDGSKVKITSISPGPVETELVGVEFLQMMKGRIPMLKPEEISKGILYVLSTPEDVQVTELTIQPMGDNCLHGL